MRKSFLPILGFMAIMSLLPMTSRADDYGTIDFGLTGVYDSALIGNILQITMNPYHDRLQCWGSNPWSPDGEWVVYQSYRGSNNSNYAEICMMRYDGTGFTRLTSNSYCDSHASFTPDGEKIVFQRKSPISPKISVETEAEIWIMDIDGSNQVSLSQNHAGEGPVSLGQAEAKPMVSPDGTKIAFHSSIEDDYGTLWVMDIDGSNPVKVCGEYVWCSKHSWSPDSEWIIFNAKLDYTDDDNSKIFKVRPDGSSLTMLSENVEGICENWPTWSPDGDFIAYHRHDQRNGGHIYSLCIMNPDGTDKQELVYGDQVNATVCGPTSWSPDSKYILFKRYHYNEGYNSSIYLYSMKTGEVTRLTSSYDDRRAWFSPERPPYRILFRDEGSERDGGYYDDLLVVNFIDNSDEDEDEDTPKEDLTAYKASSNDNGLCFITAAAGQGSALINLILAALGVGVVLARKKTR